MEEDLNFSVMNLELLTPSALERLSARLPPALLDVLVGYATAVRDRLVRPVLASGNFPTAVRRIRSEIQWLHETRVAVVGALLRDASDIEVLGDAIAELGDRTLHEPAVAIGQEHLDEMRTSLLRIQRVHERMARLSTEVPPSEVHLGQAFEYLSRSASVVEALSCVCLWALAGECEPRKPAVLQRLIENLSDATVEYVEAFEDWLEASGVPMPLVPALDERAADPALSRAFREAEGAWPFGSEFELTFSGEATLESLLSKPPKPRRALRDLMAAEHSRTRSQRR